jgi:hypothetical protein
LNPGLPPEDCFPVQSLQLGLAGISAPVQLDTRALLAAQQLGMAVAGYPPLRRWVAAHVAALHAPPAAHDVLITAGSSNGLEVCEFGCVCVCAWRVHGGGDGLGRATVLCVCVCVGVLSAGPWEGQGEDRSRGLTETVAGAPLKRATEPLQ